MSSSKGKLLVFSAPSGAGKTTIVRSVLKEFPELAFLFLLLHEKEGKLKLTESIISLSPKLSLRKKLIMMNLLNGKSFTIIITVH
jgi:ABC-type proline/glycine betaine transport system ATPase subunit